MSRKPDFSPDDNKKASVDEDNKENEGILMHQGCGAGACRIVL